MRRIIFFAVLALAVGVGFSAFKTWRGTPVRVITAQMLPLEQWVVASGQVRYQSLARIGAEITGTVAERFVREGDQVQAGDLLISLHQDDWLAQYKQAQTALAQLTNQLYPQALESLAEARLAYQQAQREAQRRTQLAEQGMLSTEQSEQAQSLAKTRKTSLTRAELLVRSLQPGGDEERLLQQRLQSAKANLDKTQISAPFAGRVQTRNVEPGDQVQPGKVLLEIARLDGLEIVAAVDEKYMAPLQLGQSAVVIADAWPEHELPATVSFIAPAVDESSGTLDVHLQVQDSEARLRQGMTVSVSILTAQKQQALLVPKDYIWHTEQGWQVYTLADGKTALTPIELGLQSTTAVEVIKGITAGTQLVLPDDVKQLGQSVRPVLEAH
ncbi:MAG: efflux RND transporter periplasmic adaptor subunit [Gammaproteobacteria bacterium]|nr:efflux RND transporter periplasmic adaptor subunit [Gammaproteobacteria bacterium]